MEQTCLLSRRQVERGDAATGFLLAEWKRIIGAKHYRIDAGDIEQIAQRRVVVHAGIEKDAAEILARAARVVGRDEFRAHAEAVLDAADRVRKRAPAMREAHFQLGQALQHAAEDQAARCARLLGRHADQPR